MSGGRDWAVVGGGLLGLTLARRLAGSGARATVYEAAESLGGLASAWSLGDVTWDRHYHVTLLSDASTRGLLRELDLERDMRWVVTRTGFWDGKALRSISSALEWATLPALGPVAKARIAATILHGSRIEDGSVLDEVPVEEWLVRWSGRQAFERLWRPLLAAKLGEDWSDVSAAFLWATIRRLWAARRTGLKREMFGYVGGGGYARVMDRFAEVLAGEGVTLRTGTPVEAIVRDGERLVVRTAGETVTHDRVVVTAPSPVSARLCPDLDADERARLEGVRWCGIVCASLLLRRRLAGYYLTYLAERLPFTAIVEMTAMVDPAELGGRTLVYLPRYLAPDDPFLRADDDEVRRTFLAALRRVHPDVTDDDVLAFRVSRVPRVYAVPTLGQAARRPPMKTSVPGLFLASSANIEHGTLNVDETVALAERAFRDVLLPAETAA